MLSAILASSVSLVSYRNYGIFFGIRHGLECLVLSELLSVLMYITQLLVNVVAVPAQPQTRRCREKRCQNKNQRSARLRLQCSI